MSQEQLMDRYLRLERKLSMTHLTWHSGRIACLTEALRAVERELQALRGSLAAAGHAAL